jgi:hypothetical protein
MQCDPGRSLDEGENNEHSTQSYLSAYEEYSHVAQLFLLELTCSASSGSSAVPLASAVFGKDLVKLPYFASGCQTRMWRPKLMNGLRMLTRTSDGGWLGDKVFESSTEPTLYGRTGAPKKKGWTLVYQSVRDNRGFGWTGTRLRQPRYILECGAKSCSISRRGGWYSSARIFGNSSSTSIARDSAPWYTIPIALKLREYQKHVNGHDPFLFVQDVARFRAEGVGGQRVLKVWSDG